MTSRSSFIPRTGSSATARSPRAGKEDLHLVNAGGQHVTLQPGAAIVHHANSFALIRSGRIDVTVLGAYEVAENGDFANWKMAGQQGGGIGGAMDLASCAKHVFVAMEHQTRDGKPRLVERCAIPATARGVVNLVATNFGLFESNPGWHGAARDRPRRNGRGSEGDHRMQPDHPPRGPFRPAGAVDLANQKGKSKGL